MDEEKKDNAESNVNDSDFLSRELILEGFELIRNYPYGEDGFRNFPYNEDEY